MPALAESPLFDHGSRRERVVREILAGLFTGKYEAGQRMRVESLAEQFEVSATPVREALVELAGVGILDLQPNRGAVLRKFGPIEILELIQVRRILECEAVRCACERFAPFELTQLEQEFIQLNSIGRDEHWLEMFRKLDIKLHDLIASRSGSQRLAHEIKRYSILFTALDDARYAKRDASENSSSKDENEEHLQILRSMAARDPQSATQAMARHIDHLGELLIHDLFGNTPDLARTPQTTMP